MNDYSSCQIEIRDVDDCGCVNTTLLRKCIRETLRHFAIRSARISVAIVNDQRIAALHKTYLGQKRTTDVLTFDLSTDPTTTSPDEPLDGEIVISAETALRCASAKGHSVEAEIALYAVHGTLHLLGLDDSTPKKARHMHALEDDILTAVGAGMVYDKKSKAQSRKPKTKSPKSK